MKAFRKVKEAILPVAKRVLHQIRDRITNSGRKVAHPNPNPSPTLILAPTLTPTQALAQTLALTPTLTRSRHGRMRSSKTYSRRRATGAMRPAALTPTLARALGLTSALALTPTPPLSPNTGLDPNQPEPSPTRTLTNPNPSPNPIQVLCHRGEAVRPSHGPQALRARHTEATPGTRTLTLTP
jgi:hypothetical protein